jgi:hypothetical protein
MIGGVEADIDAGSVASSDGAWGGEFPEYGRIDIVDVFVTGRLGVVGIGDACGGRNCGGICCWGCECDDTTKGC